MFLTQKIKHSGVLDVREEEGREREREKEEKAQKGRGLTDEKAQEGERREGSGGGRVGRSLTDDRHMPCFSSQLHSPAEGPLSRTNL